MSWSLWLISHFNDHFNFFLAKYIYLNCFCFSFILVKGTTWHCINYFTGDPVLIFWGEYVPRHPITFGNKTMRVGIKSPRHCLLTRRSILCWCVDMAVYKQRELVSLIMKLSVTPRIDLKYDTLKIYI